MGIVYFVCSYVITGSDHNHQDIRGILVEDMKGEHREECTNYCYTQNDILLGGQCFSMEEYIKKVW